MSAYLTTCLFRRDTLSSMQTVAHPWNVVVRGATQSVRERGAIGG